METFTFDVENITLEDKKTWDLICNGRTKGVFQLESSLGRSWAKKVKPKNMEELSDLIAIIRPGCLKAIQDGKSMTQHYVDRKDGDSSVTYVNNALEPILKKTQGVLVYQEQAMKIAQQLAGFTLQEADDLRKAIGKKKADLMAEVKKKFLKGAIKEEIVSEEEAEEIFGWIEASSRYSFNKSHAISYAICAYWSAYAKAHFPLEFYCNYLKYSGGKPDPQREVKELVTDAKSNDIFIHPPSLEHLNEETSVIDGKVYFGLKNIKSLGANTIISIKENIKEARSLLATEIWCWYDFLILTSRKINKTAARALISSGVLSGLKTSRQKMLYEFDTFEKLSNKETEWIEKNYKNFSSLTDILRSLARPRKEGGGVTNKNRLGIVNDLIQQLENPPVSLEDDPEWIVRTEENYYGVALTYSKVDAVDVSRGNTTCKDILNGKKGNLSIVVTVNEARKYTPIKGKNAGKDMGFLEVEDATGSMDGVTLFYDAWDKYKNMLYNGNNILIIGKTSGGKRDGIIVDEIFEL